ncbi:MAG: type II secretion system F family protein [Armatimonadota bacterium]
MSDSTCHPDMLRFWQLMAEGFAAGQQLGGLLKSISGQLPAEPMGNAAAALAHDVAEDQTLSQAMKNQPAIFTKAHVCLVEGGELVGRLDLLLSVIVELTQSCPACGGLKFPED